jgi:hypothetical protein
MVTGVTLDDNLYANNVRFWIGSVPPYYCSNNGPSGADNLNADDVWIGNSFITAASPAVPVKYTNGVKYAADSDGGENPGQLVRYVDGTGAPVVLTFIKETSTYQPAPYLQTQYQIGLLREPMFFGPYDLNKTFEGSNFPPRDGDIIFITTGSDVIGGALEDGAAPNSIGDTRVFNLIFYSTGSGDVAELSEWVGNSNQTERPSSAVLSDYTITTRADWYADTGVTGFVGIRSDNSANDVIWWPLTYNDSTPEIIGSRNDS